MVHSLNFIPASRIMNDGDDDDTPLLMHKHRGDIWSVAMATVTTFYAALLGNQYNWSKQCYDHS